MRSVGDYRQNVINYLHIPDLLFHEAVEEFVNHRLYNVLGAKCYWRRYDFSVFKDGIQTHALEKCKHDLGMCNLSKIIY